VVQRAAAFGYDGIEWRGGTEGHVPPGYSAAECRALRRQVAQAGLFSLAVTAYTSFTSPEAAEREANVVGARRNVDLAAELGARYVRIFLGELPAGRSRAEAYPGMVESLHAAAEYAATAEVVLAIEPHDDFVRSETVAPILEALPHPAVRVIWDVGNAYAAGEGPAESWQRLGSRLAYVQVKDGVGQGATWRLKRLGEGHVPLVAAIELLRAAPQRYAGAISLEWERAWHPELDSAQQALPGARRVLATLLAPTAAQAAGH
jgi:sugar phosphate isomerase/epimerase